MVLLSYFYILKFFCSLTSLYAEKRAREKKIGNFRFRLDGNAIPELHIHFMPPAIKRFYCDSNSIFT